MWATDEALEAIDQCGKTEGYVLPSDDVAFTAPEAPLWFSKSRRKRQAASLWIRLAGGPWNTDG